MPTSTRTAPRALPLSVVLCLLSGGCPATDDDDAECEPEASVACVGDDLFWFDSCGEQGALATDCADCETCTDAGDGPACAPATVEKGQGCGTDGAIHWFDSCGAEGALVTSCEPCQVCAVTSPTTAECQAAEPEAAQQCGADDHVHWIDSCGDEGPVATPCDSCAPCVDTGAETAECVPLDDFTACEVVTAPDRDYDLCVDGICVSPGCGDPSCNVPGPHFPLADTGQRTCYDAELPIGCPAPGAPYAGQDAQYGWDTAHDPGDRFAVDLAVGGDPVVHDLVTGLHWQGCPHGQSQGGCASGFALPHEWAAAVAACEALDWGGYDDWRLPDEYELMSIVDSGTAAPSADPDAFPATPPDFFWTSSAFITENLALAVHFDGGAAVALNIAEPWLLARCVRGQPSPIPQRYDAATVDGDWVVHDLVTGLDWQGAATPAAWGEALAYCEGLSWGLHDDWRVPNLQELRSIQDSRRAKPALDEDVFGLTPSGYFWTGTTLSAGPPIAWSVNADDGQVIAAAKWWGGYEYVRCVRGG